MNIFEKLFSRKKTKTETSRADLLSGGTVFTPFSGNAYANDIYREAVDAIARNTAKITGAHIIKTDGGRVNGDTRLIDCCKYVPTLT